MKKLLLSLGLSLFTNYALGNQESLVGPETKNIFVSMSDLAKHHPNVLGFSWLEKSGPCNGDQRIPSSLLPQFVNNLADELYG